MGSTRGKQGLVARMAGQAVDLSNPSTTNLKEMKGNRIGGLHPIVMHMMTMHLLRTDVVISK